MSIRPYIDNKRLHIDGRMIPYPLVNASDYLEEKFGMKDSEIESFIDNHYKQYTMLNTIIAMKQSCFLLRHVGYSCGSLASDLYDHKKEMVAEYNKTYDPPFDEDFYENYSKRLSNVVDHLRDVDWADLTMPIAVIYDKPLDFPDKYAIRLFDKDKATNIIVLRDSLEDCRKECMDSGLTGALPRSIDDDLCIVESWI